MFRIKLILVLALFGLSLSAEETVFLTENNAYAILNRFLGRVEVPQTYEGITSRGEYCAVSIEKTPRYFSITLDPRTASENVMVYAKPVLDVSGSVSPGSFFLHYFFDDPSAHHPHGQFGTSINLNIELDGNQKLSSVSYKKRRVDDLNSKVLFSVTCQGLR